MQINLQTCSIRPPNTHTHNRRSSKFQSELFFSISYQSAGRILYARCAPAASQSTNRVCDVRRRYTYIHKKTSTATKLAPTHTHNLAASFGLSVHSLCSRVHIRFNRRRKGREISDAPNSLRPTFTFSSFPPLTDDCAPPSLRTD